MMTIRIVPFLVFLSPPLIVSCIAHHCDKTTFNYVKHHSLRGNSIEMTSNQTGAEHNPQEQELTDRQKELLKIPLNAIRMSLLSFLPFGVTVILKFLMMDFPDLFRVQIFVMLCCVLQGSRIVIILTCILKANKINQVEISQAEKRAQRQEWERTHSFRAKNPHRRTGQGPEHEQIPSHHIQRKSNDLRRQTLDPGLLENIARDISE